MKEFKRNVVMHDGPFVKGFGPEYEEDTNVISRKIVTRKVRDGKLVEITNTRLYRDNDYFDSSHTEVICDLTSHEQ